MTKTALIAIAKNEGFYIREWVLYHKKVCGFGEIVIYENDSTDNTVKELNSLQSEGLCSWKTWPRSEQNPPQQKAYWNALERKGDWDWMCLIDIDEFLVLRPGNSIGSFVNKFDEDVGSISFNWLVFYSHEKNRTNDPVVKRVNNFYRDPQFKTIARTRAISSSGIHAFWLLPGWRYMHCSGAEYRLEKVDADLESNMLWAGAHAACDTQAEHINHYMMKSEEEVIIRDERGDALRRHHAKKRTLVPYRQRLRSKVQEEDHTIKKYIESMYGLKRFYDDLCA